MMMKKCLYLACVLLLLPPQFNGETQACTTAVISGKVTTDGRPLLWKNRDYTSAPRNEVAIFDGGKYRAIAAVNAGNRTSAWMGTNETGFCIENSLSSDLKSDEPTSGLTNGTFMKLALEGGFSFCWDHNASVSGA